MKLLVKLVGTGQGILVDASGYTIGHATPGQRMPAQEADGCLSVKLESGGVFLCAPGQWQYIRPAEVATKEKGRK